MASDLLHLVSDEESPARWRGWGRRGRTIERTGWAPRNASPVDRNAAATEGYFLREKLIAKRPLRLANADNKNSHRAEIEVGLRLIG